MATLSTLQIINCPANSPCLTLNEAQQNQQKVPSWTINTDSAALQLERTFLLQNFVEAIKFTNEIAELAEANNHHPSITTQWGKVTVSWWTHSVKGLHLNDFIMAAKTDDAFLPFTTE